MKTIKYLYGISFLLLAMALTPAYGQPFVEPEMGDYTNHPIFHVQSQAPNILVILDNSGSMNFAAYGEWAGTDNRITAGEHGEYNDPNTTVDEGEVTYYIDYSNGSAEERSESFWDRPVTGSDTKIEMGRFDTGYKSYVGFRFTDVSVQEKTTIDRAYIQFTSFDADSEATSLNVSGHDVDDAPRFRTDWRNNLVYRFGDITSARTIWTPPDWTANQKDNNTRVDVTGTVQELLNRNGWDSGNDMVFLIEGSGKRDVHSHNTTNPSYSPELHIEYTPEEKDEDDFLYYGYFDRGTLDNSTKTQIYTASRYTYNDSEGRFERDPNGEWDGNWLNWCTSRRVDVLRKVLVGGKLAGTSGDDALTNIGENNYRGWNRNYNNTSGISTPYTGEKNYRVDDDWLYVDGKYYNIKVLKDPNYDDLDDFNDDGTELSGLLQNVGNKARWGNMWFDFDSGGWLDNRIADNNVDNVIDNVRDKPCDTWTPLAETYHTAMEYFQQQGTSDYGITRYQDNETYDPYVTDDNDTIFCAKSFVILLTDGASTQDTWVPEYLKRTDSDISENSGTECTDQELENMPSGDCYRDFWNDSSKGSDYLDDIAYYTHINDLRPDLDSTQNLSLYVVYAFDDDPKARALLKDAAINGGFIDMDDDNKPDIMGDPRGGQWGDIGHDEEWDEDGDGDPDNYWEAKDGADLKASLETAINEILKQASSGTSVSVLATRGEGEGTLTQAFFKPSLPVEGSTADIRWLGYLQMLWIDSFGNVREDTVSDKKLDIYADNIVRFFLDPETGGNSITRYSPSEDYPYPPADNATWVEGDLASLSPLWEAGELLSKRSAGTRTIFTHTINSATDISTQIDFSLANTGTLTPYLGVEDDTTWGTDANLGNSESDRIHNIINFVLGEPAAYQGDPSIRPRTTDDNTLWKLGDIIYSTPVTVSRPVENYGLIYDDASYWPYYTKYAERETVVYVGANDGMLHAFSAGVYNSDNQTFEDPPITGTSIVGTIGKGDEMWGFIPNSLLPHLKWLPQVEYTHVPYVDLKVRITDARIFPDDGPTGTHPNGWGTVLIGGLNFGGKNISAQNVAEDQCAGEYDAVEGYCTFKPSIFAIDVTNPRNPEVLWEKSFDNLGFTTNTPSFIRSGGEWMLAVASGPTHYDFTELTGILEVSSNQYAHVYILDLETGTVLKDFGGSGETYDNSYMSSPVSFDKHLNYNVDAVYMGSAYDNGTINKGAIYKITIPQTGDDFFPCRSGEACDDLYYDDTPTSKWKIRWLADSPVPITAPLLLSIDRYKNTWLFGGTGRYMDEADKKDDAQNYLFGVKDPFFNRLQYTVSGEYWNYTGEESAPVISIDPADNQLFNADDYTISTEYNKTVTDGDDTVTSFSQLLSTARTYDGWVRSLCPGTITDDDTFAGNCSGSGPSERLVNKQALLGGILLSPTFSPNADICGYGGMGRLWALYYETGTAWKYQIYGNQGGDEIEDTMFLGSGLTSSFGIHVGRQKGGTVFGQMSTGVIQRIDITPAFEQKSQPSYWKDYLE